MDTQSTESERHVPLAELVEEWRAHRPDLLLHDAGGPRECLVRAGELVVTPDGLDQAVDRLGRWIERIEPAEGLDLARIRLRGSEHHRCVDIAEEVGQDISLSANHVHVGAPLMFGAPVLIGTPLLIGTGAGTNQAAPVPAPPEQAWQPQVNAVVLDTGLDPHPWFARRSWLAEWGLSPEVLDGDGAPGQDRQAGHGTFVAGVLLRHAPGVTLRHQRVLSSFGLTDDLTVVAGLRRVRRIAAARDVHLDVLVLTAGCHTSGDTCPPLLRREISRFDDAVVVAAAGNGATSRPFWPAALPEVVAVAATGPDGELAAFSNRGDWVDAAAVGVDVVSSYVRLRPATGDTAPGTETREYGFARWSGTSFAAPRVAAEVAALRHQGLSPAEARALACARHPVRP